jgi:hypothetical protein
MAKSGQDVPCDLLKYLAEAFPGLVLNPPLFYRWPVGIRFDLGGRALKPDEVDLVLLRAASLFEAAFSAEDTCIVVAQDWPEENRLPWLARIVPLFTFARSNAAGLDAPQGRLETLDEEEPEVGPYTLTWVKQPARVLDYRLIFSAIANADHGRSPAISSRVYLINLVSNVILHMYDDRGLDLIASRKDALSKVYRDFNSWILDYDRAQINRTFAD